MKIKTHEDVKELLNFSEVRLDTTMIDDPAFNALCFIVDGMKSDLKAVMDEFGYNYKVKTPEKMIGKK